MKKSPKYDTSGLPEAQFEPGSRGRVLKNLLGIKKKREMDAAETAEQDRVLAELLAHFDAGHGFTASDVCQIHKKWLGAIYPWAGQYRNVNVSKGGLSFAAAQHIPSLMHEFEKSILRKHTPCKFASMGEIGHSLAVVHVELALIHPFREGNGRLARILAILMALQAGLPPLDFQDIKGKKKQDYFEAIRQGLSRNYMPMEEVFKRVIRKTLKLGRGEISEVWFGGGSASGHGYGDGTGSG